MVSLLTIEPQWVLSSRHLKFKSLYTPLTLKIWFETRINPTSEWSAWFEERTLRKGVISLKKFEVDRVSGFGEDESRSEGEDVGTSYLDLWRMFISSLVIRATAIPNRWDSRCELEPLGGREGHRQPQRPRYSLPECKKATGP